MSSKNRHVVIVRSVLGPGLTLAQVSATFGVSRQWVHVLLDRYRTSGADALEP